jgi:excisionase family DNA binding protein
VARLLTTAEAARELGISARTLAQWAKDGTATPVLTTVGGHHRWDLDALVAELRAQRQRDE